MTRYVTSYISGATDFSSSHWTMMDMLVRESGEDLNWHIEKHRFAGNFQLSSIACHMGSEVLALKTLAPKLSALMKAMSSLTHLDRSNLLFLVQLSMIYINVRVVVDRYWGQSYKKAKNSYSCSWKCEQKPSQLAQWHRNKQPLQISHKGCLARCHRCKWNTRITCWTFLYLQLLWTFHRTLEILSVCRKPQWYPLVVFLMSTPSHIWKTPSLSIKH